MARLPSLVGRQFEVLRAVYADPNQLTITYAQALGSTTDIVSCTLCALRTKGFVTSHRETDGSPRNRWQPTGKLPPADQR